MSRMTQITHINRAELMAGNGAPGIVVKHSEGNALLVTNATSGLKRGQHAPTACPGQRGNGNRLQLYQGREATDVQHDIMSMLASAHSVEASASQTGPIHSALLASPRACVCKAFTLNLRSHLGPTYAATCQCSQQH
jgi:hypothetical protein